MEPVPLHPQSDRHDRTKWVIDQIDRFIKPLIWYSVFMLILEIEMGSESSYESHWFFLWSERFVAGVLTLEYIFRCWRNSGRYFYPLSPFGIIDLLAIVPFWIGFLAPLGLISQSSLHLVRTLRILRLLKFFRYNRNLQLVALAYYRAWQRIKPLAFTTLIMCLFTMMFLVEIEPHNFPSTFEAGWFIEVTGTTVGYGDKSPDTVLGKGLMMAFMIGGLAIFAAVLSAINSSFEETFAEEANPDIDPLLEFSKTFRKRKALAEIDKNTGTTNAEDAAKVN